MDVTKDKKVIDDRTWWLKTMEHVRTVSGKIYRDQLHEIAQKNYIEWSNADNLRNLPNFSEDEGIVAYLNQHSPLEGVKFFLKEDPDTGCIYTIPSQRKRLDQAIYEMNADYKYNCFLYADKSVGNCMCRDKISFENLQKTDFTLFLKVFSYDNNTSELKIDLTQLAGKHPYCFDSFDLDEIYDYYIENVVKPNKREDFHFGEINGSWTIFSGKTNLAIDSRKRISPLFTGGMCFKGATFLEDVYIQNIEFCFNSTLYHLEKDYATNKIDFRNSRFFKSVIMRDIHLRGNAHGIRISFEDARIENNLEIANTEFGNVELYCFQMIMGNYVEYIEDTEKNDKSEHFIKLINIDAEDKAELDFSDVEIDNGKIILDNISNLPLTRICLASRIDLSEMDKEKCPNNYLAIRNCNINHPLFIGNVSALSMEDTSNYSSVEEAGQWGDFGKKEGKYKPEIQNNLLKAVYNNKFLVEDTDTTTKQNDSDAKRFKLNYVRAKDFVLLKVNFYNRGLYDLEDEALKLYMRYKPYIDSKKLKHCWYTEIAYRILDFAGRYGTSPLRILFILLAVIVVFTAIYAGFFGAGQKDDFVIQAVLYSIANIIPFRASFEMGNWVEFVAAIESAIGTFLVGYFSVAVVRKTMR